MSTKVSSYQNMTKACNPKLQAIIEASEDEDEETARNKYTIDEVHIEATSPTTKDLKSQGVLKASQSKIKIQETTEILDEEKEADRISREILWEEDTDEEAEEARIRRRVLIEETAIFLYQEDCFKKNIADIYMTFEDLENGEPFAACHWQEEAENYLAWDRRRKERLQKRLESRYLRKERRARQTMEILEPSNLQKAWFWFRNIL